MNRREGEGKSGHLALTMMKTSNSSRQRNGASMASQRDMMKQTVVKERSPPESARVFLVPCEARDLVSTWT